MAHEKERMSWNDVKEKYMEFHKIDSFTEGMAIDVDFGYWLVNNCIQQNLLQTFPSNPEIYKWIKDKRFQREQGDQEYMMLFEIDMPKILKAFVVDFLSTLPEEKEEKSCMSCMHQFKSISKEPCNACSEFDMFKSKNK